MNKCIKINGSLVTIFDEDDAEFVNQLSIFKKNKETWLGLHKSQHSNVSNWSNGVPFTFHMFNMSHVNVTHGEQICEAIENNIWKGFNCSDRKPFMCSQNSKFQHAYFDVWWNNKQQAWITQGLSSCFTELTVGKTYC